MLQTVAYLASVKNPPQSPLRAMIALYRRVMSMIYSKYIYKVVGDVVCCIQKHFSLLRCACLIGITLHHFY